MQINPYASRATYDKKKKTRYVTNNKNAPSRTTTNARGCLPRYNIPLLVYLSATLLTTMIQRPCFEQGFGGRPRVMKHKFIDILYHKQPKCRAKQSRHCTCWDNTIYSASIIPLVVVKPDRAPPQCWPAASTARGTRKIDLDYDNIIITVLREAR